MNCPNKTGTSRPLVLAVRSPWQKFRTRAERKAKTPALQRQVNGFPLWSRPLACDDFCHRPLEVLRRGPYALVGGHTDRCGGVKQLALPAQMRVISWEGYIYMSRFVTVLALFLLAASAAFGQAVAIGSVNGVGYGSEWQPCSGCNCDFDGNSQRDRSPGDHQRGRPLRGSQRAGRAVYPGGPGERLQKTTCRRHHSEVGEKSYPERRVAGGALTETGGSASRRQHGGDQGHLHIPRSSPRRHRGSAAQWPQSHLPAAALRRRTSTMTLMGAI